MIRRFAVLLATRFAVLLATLALSGCAYFASFSGPPAYRLDHTYREPVAGSQYTVSVSVDHQEDASGWCNLPDAGNNIHCMFSLARMDSTLLAPDGYRHLSFPVARGLCSDALWSIGLRTSPGRMDMSMGNPVINACSRALMMHRWMDDAEVYEPGPGEPR